MAVPPHLIFHLKYRRCKSKRINIDSLVRVYGTIKPWPVPPLTEIKTFKKSHDKESSGQWYTHFPVIILPSATMNGYILLEPTWRMSLTPFFRPHPHNNCWDISLCKAQKSQLNPSESQEIINILGFVLWKPWISPWTFPAKSSKRLLKCSSD